MKLKFGKKSKKNIWKSAKKIGLALFVLFLVANMNRIRPTSSAFSDTETSAGNTMTAGYWVPELSMNYTPPSPDGDNSFWKTAPCVSLSAKIGSDDATLSDVDIYYNFSNSDDPTSSDNLYTGACIPIPDGNPTQFQAIALNHQNHDWKSNVVSGQFKVDTVCPIVKITNPDDNKTLNGSVEVRGTVTDANPDHFWLVVENSSGTKVAGPGTVNDSTSFTNKKFFDWDTTTVADGNYKIKLEARDQAGNKCPNQSSDPNNPNDSVDWIDVKVENRPTVRAGDVVINEVMWMGSQKDDGTSYAEDEWIELRNTKSYAIDVKNWNIYGTKKGGHYEISGGSSVLIPGGGYLLISDKDRDDSRIDVAPDFTNNNLDFENDYADHGQIILKNKDGLTIDETPNPSSSDHDWPAGLNDTHVRWSMERNNDPSSGWHTCNPTAMTTDQLDRMKNYWDGNARLYNCGTPGHANLSKNDPSEKDIEEFLGTEEKDAAVETPPVGNNDAEVVAEEKPVIVQKEFDIKLSGKLDIPEGFLAETDQKMKKIELSGEEKVINDLKNLEIDLSKIKIEKAGKIEILVSDLNLPKDADLVTAKKDDTVVLITVTEKPKEEPKKEEIKKVDADLPKADSPKEDEEKDDSADGAGGSEEGSGSSPKSVDSATP